MPSSLSARSYLITGGPFLRAGMVDQLLDAGAPQVSRVAADLSINCTHHIINVRDLELVTAFWSNDLYDPAEPNACPERVTRT